MIKVLVVEDHLMTRMGLVHVISLIDDNLFLSNLLADTPPPTKTILVSLYIYR